MLFNEIRISIFVMYFAMKVTVEAPIKISHRDLLAKYRAWGNLKSGRNQCLSRAK